jgi:O-antigen/teichoic acid export membrane protein
VRALLGRIWNAFDGLAEDTLWAGAHDIYAAVVTLMAFLMLSRVLPEERYGAMFGLYGILTPLGALTFAGPGLALLQRWYRHQQPQNQILTSFLSLTLLVGTLSTVLAVTAGLIYIELTAVEILLIVASELWGNSVIFISAWLVQIAVGFPAMIRVKMGSITLKLIAVAGLSLSDQLSIRNLAASYVVLYGLYACWLVGRRLPALGYRVRLRVPPIDAYRSSAVFAVPMVASGVQTDSDKFFLNAFDHRADAGQYGAAFRIIQLGIMPLRVVGQAVFYRFLQTDPGTSGANLRRVLQLTGLLLVLGSGIAAFMYLASPLIDLLLVDEYREAKTIARWLLLFPPLLALSMIPTNGLLTIGRTRERAVVHLTSSAVSVALYLLLIPSWGWEGAVAATLLAELYLAVAGWSTLIYYERKASRFRAQGSLPVG